MAASLLPSLVVWIQFANPPFCTSSFRSCQNLKAFSAPPICRQRPDDAPCSTSPPLHHPTSEYSAHPRGYINQKRHSFNHQLHLSLTGESMWTVFHSSSCFLQSLLLYFLLHDETHYLIAVLNFSAQAEMEIIGNSFVTDVRNHWLWGLASVTQPWISCTEFLVAPCRKWWMPTR